MRDLQPSDHGRRFSAKIHGNSVEGKVCYENGKFYLCQNNANGARPYNTLGYKYGYGLGKGEVRDFKLWDIADFKFTSMTAKEIEEYKDFKKGDVIKLNSGTKVRIEEQLGNILFPVAIETNSTFLPRTASEMYNAGWRLDVTPEEETPIVFELSVAEIAKKLGIDVKLLKVVDK